MVLFVTLECSKRYFFGTLEFSEVPCTFKKITKNPYKEWYFLVLWNVPNGTFWYFGMFQMVLFGTVLWNVPNGVFWYFGMFQMVLFVTFQSFECSKGTFLILFGTLK